MLKFGFLWPITAGSGGKSCHGLSNSRAAATPMSVAVTARILSLMSCLNYKSWATG